MSFTDLSMFAADGSGTDPASGASGSTGDDFSFIDALKPAVSLFVLIRSRGKR